LLFTAIGLFFFLFHFCIFAFLICQRRYLWTIAGRSLRRWLLGGGRLRRGASLGRPVVLASCFSLPVLLVLVSDHHQDWPRLHHGHASLLGRQALLEVPDSVGLDPVEDALLFICEAVFQLFDADSERLRHLWLQRLLVCRPRLIGIQLRGSSAESGESFHKRLLERNSWIESFVYLIPDLVI